MTLAQESQIHLIPCSEVTTATSMVTMVSALNTEQCKNCATEIAFILNVQQYILQRYHQKFNNYIIIYTAAIKSTGDRV